MTRTHPGPDLIRGAIALGALALWLVGCHTTVPATTAARQPPAQETAPANTALEEVVVTEASRLQSPPLPAKVVGLSGLVADSMREVGIAGANYYAGAPATSWAPDADRERYASIPDNGVVAAGEQPFSTFSIDVDTGSYSNVRRLLNAGRLPPPDAVRVEELVNYFPYAYAEPATREGKRLPFGVTTEVAATPWNPDTLLLRVGIKAFDLPRAKLPAANLVFLVDVSGSMNEPDKLPLLKNALKLLVGQLRAEDRISLVTYADGTRIVLRPTPGSEKAQIRQAIDELVAGGSTAGAAGIQLAYQMAQQGYIRDGINRILLATDGDFNVGITDFAQLKGMVAEKRRSGVSLSTLGFGSGNYNDEMMEQVADAGDGNYAYIDSLSEAQKVLVDEAASTLSIVARDVKIQLEFNPGVVAEYRLLGYENRKLAREDFRNETVDAGEIGAGHTVTALYELSLVGHQGLLGASRYAMAHPPIDAGAHAGELAMLRLRYKQPDGTTAPEIAAPISRDAQAAGDDLRFAAAVAAFGQQLRGGKYLGRFGYREIEALAAGARGEDRYGYRGEFLQLLKLASSLAMPASPPVAAAY
jgi:Ca-activated chloride channel homolog